MWMTSSALSTISLSPSLAMAITFPSRAHLLEVAHQLVVQLAAQGGGGHSSYILAQGPSVGVMLNR